MPLLPIDLQIMFSRMDQIGKEQSIQMQVASEVQARQASEMAKQSELRDHSVNQTGIVGDGIEKVDEKQHEREKRKGKAGQDSSEKEGKQKENYFRDPALGHHVDITR